MLSTPRRNVVVAGCPANVTLAVLWRRPGKREAIIMAGAWAGSRLLAASSLEVKILAEEWLRSNLSPVKKPPNQGLVVGTAGHGFR